MYTKEELKELKLKFWAGFKAFVQNHPNPEIKRKRWLLNDTGVSGVAFRFDFDRENACVMIELQHKNEARRLRTFEILEQYKVVMEEGFQDGLNWEFYHKRDDNRQEVCRIYHSLENVDFHQPNHWPEVYVFFAENMPKLEENFLMVKEVLKEELRKFTI
ncbi:MAG TPA: DUF4268 domain-containing protein [Prolixibacteraceae bacterium]|nr:DUF4268 domain-containing protein [Prolixibacteraceae bacterium]